MGSPALGTSPVQQASAATPPLAAATGFHRDTRPATTTAGGPGEWRPGLWLISRPGVCLPVHCKESRASQPVHICWLNITACAAARHEQAWLFMSTGTRGPVNRTSERRRSRPCPGCSAAGLSCHPGYQRCYNSPRLEGQPCSDEADHMRCNETTLAGDPLSCDFKATKLCVKYQVGLAGNAKKASCSAAVAAVL